MEKLGNPYDKEHMRLAMLKHEEVFREQVFELHRVYQIQKMLMKSIKRSGQNYQEHPTWNFKNCKGEIHGLDLEIPAEEYRNNHVENGCLKSAKIEDESELLELTLGPSKNFYRRRKVTHAPILSSLLLKSDNYSGTSLSSSSSSNIIKKHNQDHQQKMNISRQENNSQKWRMDNVVGEENLRQDRSMSNNFPWSFQVLSLKMT